MAAPFPIFFVASSQFGQNVASVTALKRLIRLYNNAAHGAGHKHNEGLRELMAARFDGAITKKRTSPLGREIFRAPQHTALSTLIPSVGAPFELPQGYNKEAFIAALTRSSLIPLFTDKPNIPQSRFTLGQYLAACQMDVSKL